MKKMFAALAVLVAASMVAACGTTSGTLPSGTRMNANIEREFGVVTVWESARVWLLYDQADGDLARFAQSLIDGVRNGTLEPANGRFEFMPYANGRPYADEPYVVNVTEGLWFFRAPADYSQVGLGMCVTAPYSWGGIATQRRFPQQAGPRTNCIAITPEVGLSRNQAGVIVMVRER